MHALIHIGIPKSGTSTIQAFLAANRAALGARGVVHAPFNPRFGSQFEFAVTALQATGATIRPPLERRRLGFRTQEDQARYVTAYHEFLGRTLRATSGARLFLGSSEHIYAWLTTPETIAALDHHLHEHFESVRYLVYLRAQDELITSTYSEAIRRGATHDFKTHMARHRRINHWRKIRMWSQVVTRGRLQVRLMQRDALIEGDLLHDFCTQAGVSVDGLQRPAPHNTALSVEEIALRRNLNRVLPVQGRDGGPSRLYQTALQLATRAFLRGHSKLRLPDDMREIIRAANADGNEKIRLRFFKDRAQLF